MHMQLVIITAWLMAITQVAVADDRSIQQNKSLAYYKSHSPWTSPGKYQSMYKDIPDEIDGIVKTVQGVLIHGGLLWLYAVKPSEQQLGGENLRRVENILQNIKKLDDKPLTIERPPHKRLAGNCRTIALLTCSILRHKGLPARIRGGYALYTYGRGKYENHWICEYWHDASQRWIRVDAQIDDKQKKLMDINFNILDVPYDQFIPAEAGWQRYQNGKANAENFGLGGKEGWHAIGLGMLMPDVLLDFMALNKTEPLPWDLSQFWSKPDKKITIMDNEFLNKIADISANPDTQFDMMRELYEQDARFQMPKIYFDQELKKIDE